MRLSITKKRSKYFWEPETEHRWCLPSVQQLHVPAEGRPHLVVIQDNTDKTLGTVTSSSSLFSEHTVFSYIVDQKVVFKEVHDL